jgi:toxin ParE1/3/4
VRIYRLSAAAEDDIVELLAYTESRFGDAARRRYQALLIMALRNISLDPDRPGSVARPELGPGVRSYHLSHSRDRARSAEGFVRRPRHVVLYRVVRPDILGVGRILHDGMEITRHMPSRYGDE